MIAGTSEREVWPPVRLVGVAAAVAAGIVGSGWAPGLAAAAAPWVCAAAAAVIGWPWRRAPRARVLGVVLVAALVGAALAARERAHAVRVAGMDDRAIDVIDGIVAGPVIASPGRTSFVIDARGARVLVSAANDDAARVLPGDRVRVTGRLRTPRGYRNPGGVDRRQVVRDRGGDLELSARELVVVERAAAWTPWRAAIQAHRAAVARVAARGGDAEGNAIVRGAVVGDRSAIDEATDDAWRAAGIYHALSVSGLHLAVVALLLFGIVWRAWAAIPALALRLDPARVAAVVAAPGAIAYTLITGGQTATVRALVAVLAILAAAWLRRRLAMVDAVGLAGLAMLLVRPSAIAEPSFQLSFVATITLCVAAARRDPGYEVDAPARTRAARLARWLGGWAWRGVRTSLWVTATTAPITAYHFHEVAVGGVVGNLVLGTAVELLVIPAGLLGLVLGAAGGPVLDLAIALTAVVDDAAALLARVTPVLEVPPPRAVEVVAYAGVLVGLAHAGRGRAHRRTGAAIAAGAAAALAAAIAWSAIAPRVHDELRVTFLDVGQGDAAVIETPAGEVWLVDAGGLPARPTDDLPPDAAARLWRAPGEAIVRFLAHRRIRRVDVVVISHPHPDHYLGLLALDGAVAIGELWIPRPAHAAPAEPDMPTFDDVAARLAARGTRVVHPPLGDARAAGDVTLEVLAPVLDDGAGPLPVAAADPVRSVNDDSLVVAVRRAGRRVLFLGDVEEEGEARLVDAGGARADVVKVAHHGSGTSSTPALVSATGARWAVISCGRANRFRFPAPAVVARWRAAGAEVVRTDQAGAVTVTIDAAGRIAVDAVDRVTSSRGARAAP